MSKLNKFKEYFTLLKSAEYLLEKTGEKISEADLLEMSIMGNLQISLHLSEPVLARTCKLIDHPLGGGHLIKFVSDSGIVGAGDNVVSLGMLGAEVDYLLKCYKLKTDEVFSGRKKNVVPKGFFVESRNGFFSLLQDYDLNPDLEGSKAYFQKYKSAIELNDLVCEQDTYALQREEFLSSAFNIEREGKILVESSEPPKASHLVIKISELDKFIEKINAGYDENTLDEKPLATRERNTLLVLIATLCKEADIDYEARGIAGAIEKMTELEGTKISDDKIREILKLLPDAVESRKK